MLSRERRRARPGGLEPKVFLEAPKVVEQIQSLRRACERQGKRFSDVVDDQGHQYVDLVMEGGGTLGIALVGYVYALESVGIRFLSIGGTSAGSITALLLAAINRDKSEPRSARLAEILSRLELASLMDARPLARRFIQAMLRPAPSDERVWGQLLGLQLGLRRVGYGLLAIPSVLRHLGLNPGDAFMRWLEEILEAEGVETAAKLEARVKQWPRGGLFFQSDPTKEPEPLRSARALRLAMIAAEVSTGTKVDFPRTAELFWKDPAGVSPACFVRASVAVPFFFFPLRLKGLPTGNKNQWKKLVGYSGKLGTACTLVDGGIMSNFPIREFHATGVPRAPTLGVKLGTEKRKLRDIGLERSSRRGLWRRLTKSYSARPLGDFLVAIFNSARHTLDYDFIYRNPDYRQLVAYVDTGDHNWLDFELSQDAQVDLFLRGVKAGADFLRKFDWAEYKNVRRMLAEAERLATASPETEELSEEREERMPQPPVIPRGVEERQSPPGPTMS